MHSYYFSLAATNSTLIFNIEKNIITEYDIYGDFKFQARMQVVPKPMSLGLKFLYWVTLSKDIICNDCRIVLYIRYIRKEEKNDNNNF